MEWPEPLIGGRLTRRYKRFLADVVLDDGQELVVHCPNTGAMTGCAEPGSRVYLSKSHNPKRKTPYTWEIVETSDGHSVCIHSALANRLVAEALMLGNIPLLAKYTRWRGEWKLPSGSRIDFALAEDEGEANGKRDQWLCFMEVKSVTLHCGGGVGQFPDAVSARAARHIEELLRLKAAGYRVVLCFAVLHSGIESVAPAVDIDPHYAQVLRDAVAKGLEVVALGADINPTQIRLVRALPVSV